MKWKTYQPKVYKRGHFYRKRKFAWLPIQGTDGYTYLLRRMEFCYRCLQDNTVLNEDLMDGRYWAREYVLPLDKF